MKKAILTFGMFSLMMVLTSFTSNERNSIQEIITVDTGGKNGTGTMIPPAKKIDNNINISSDIAMKDLITNNISITQISKKID